MMIPLVTLSRSIASVSGAREPKKVHSSMNASPPFTLIKSQMKSHEIEL